MKNKCPLVFTYFFFVAMGKFFSHIRRFSTYHDSYYDMFYCDKNNKSTVSFLFFVSKNRVRKYFTETCEISIHGIVPFY